MLLVKMKADKQILGRGIYATKNGFNYYILPNRLEKEIDDDMEIVCKGDLYSCQIQGYYAK